MPWMLQPKNYTQIARPNLYNVAYRRVGAYKGMGRLHPTNYLEIGVRPNRIGGTTGQYNTLSGQLMLLPPSLRGLGQNLSTDPGFQAAWQSVSFPTTTGGPDTTLWNLPLTGPYTSNPVSTAAALQPAPGPLVSTTAPAAWFKQYGVYVAIGVGVLALLMGGRR